MKKLNRKGFTLVELLAVIVILAIVVGIAIPGVSGVINNAKQSALEVAMETAHDYLNDQYALYNLGQGDALFGEIMTDGKNTSVQITDAAELKQIGFGDNNVKQVDIAYNEDTSTSTIKFCVRVVKLTDTSDYFTTTNWTKGTDGTATIKGGDSAKNQYGDCNDTTIADKLS